MSGGIFGRRAALVLTSLWLASCRSPAPEEPPPAFENDEWNRRCTESVVRDWGPRPEHPPLVSCEPGNDLACGAGSVCVSWEGTSACARAVQHPGEVDGLAADPGLLVIATASLHEGYIMGRCTKAAPEITLTMEVSKEGVIGLSRVDGVGLVDLVCRRQPGGPAECDLSLSQRYRLVGYYHASGTFPQGPTFEVLHAEPLAR